MRTYRDVDVLDRAGAAVGEGPAWDTAHGALAWVDITRCQVRLSAADGTLLRTIDVGTHVSAVLPADGGGWLLATQRGLALLSEQGELEDLVDLHGDRPGLRCNDAKCDLRGRALVGTMAYDETPEAASLYRLDSGPSATVLMEGLTLPNGLGWSPDGSTFWFIDSATQTIGRYGYDMDAGSVGPLLGTVDVPAEVGMPDGLCVDDDGCAWVGLWGGSAVHRYTPDGALDAVVELPTSQVTSCAFGGLGLATLFITTATHQMSAGALAREPLAGSLFALDVGRTGPAATPWRTPG